MHPEIRLRMNELYNIVSIFVTGGLLFACGLMFLFMVIPDSPLLSNYRKARYMLAGAYLFFAAVGIVEYLLQASPPDAGNIALMQAVTLVIAASQALVFTLVLLALLETRFPGWRYIFREAAYVLLFIAAVITSCVLFSGGTFRNVLYLLIAIYALFLARYTFLFIKSCRRFNLRMDNYFSDMEAGRLRWVAFSFFAALAVGVTALFSSLFMSALTALLFAVMFDLFYLYFAIRFINYAHQFQVIEHAMDDGAPEDEAAPTPDDADAKFVNSDAFALLEKRIEKWIAAKGFTRKGITIDLLAAQLATNRSYLSRYANTCRKHTFRQWINALRIEEAQNLLRQSPEMPLNEIAERVGFSDKSNFIRCFIRHTNVSPAVWRRKYL